MAVSPVYEDNLDQPSSFVKGILPRDVLDQDLASEINRAFS